MKKGYLGYLSGTKDGRKAKEETLPTIKGFKLSYDKEHPCLYSAVKITVGDKVIVADKALWDTGATMTCIQHSMTKKLEGKPKESGSSISATDRRDSDIYLGTVELPGGIVFHDIGIWDIALEDLEAEVIIGMDIISRGRLVVETVDGMPMFSFTAEQ